MRKIFGRLNLRERFNFRLFFVLAVVSVLSITAAFNLLFGNKIWFSVYIIISALSFATPFIIYRKFNRLAAVMLYALISVFFFIVSMFLTVDNFSPVKFENETVVSGTAGDRVIYTEDTATVYLEKLIINGKKEKGRLVLVVNTEDGLSGIRAGDVFTFSAIVENKALIDKYNSFDSFAFKNNLKYYAEIEGAETLEITQGQAAFFSNLRQGIKDLLYGNIGQPEAGIAYSMFTGDTADIKNTDAISDLRVSGLAHILAVSGLHVSFVYAMFSFILSKLKAGRKISTAIISAILFLYTFICGFSASVIRASVMCLVLMLSKLFKKRYDLLSALSFSALLIVLPAPLMIYDTGFQLSYAAMAGIAAFSGMFKSGIIRMLKLNSISSALSMTLGAQIGTLPLLFNYFNIFSPYSVVSNLIAVPVAGLSFILLMTGLLISFAIPAFAVLLKWFSYPLKFITGFSGWIASLPFAEILVFSFGILIIIYLLLMMFAGRYFVASKKEKTAVSLVAAVLMLIVTASVNISPRLPAAHAYIACIPYGKTIMVTNDSGRRSLVTDLRNYYDIRKFLVGERVRNIDNLILTGKQSDAEAVKNMIKYFNVKKTYIPRHSSTAEDVYALAAQNKIELIESFTETDIGGVTITTAVESGNYYGTLIAGERSILIPNGTGKANADYLHSVGISYADVLISEKTEKYAYEYYFYFLRQDYFSNYTQLPQNRHFTYKL